MLGKGASLPAGDGLDGQAAVPRYHLDDPVQVTRLEQVHYLLVVMACLVDVDQAGKSVRRSDIPQIGEETKQPIAGEHRRIQPGLAIGRSGGAATRAGPPAPPRGRPPTAAAAAPARDAGWPGPSWPAPGRGRPGGRARRLAPRPAPTAGPPRPGRVARPAVRISPRRR